MSNAEIAAAFEEMADLLEFQGANAFRVRAYRNAARSIADLAPAVASMVAEEQDLTTLDGVGDDIAAKIALLVETGTFPQLEKLRDEVPRSALEMMRVSGVGPKKAAAIYKELGVDSREALRAACEQQQVRALKGFGAKTEANILAALASTAEDEDRIYWASADEIVERLRGHLAGSPAIERFEFAGSYRRGRETVGDLDVLATAADPEQAMDHFASFPEIRQTLGRGPTKQSVVLRSGVQVDLRVVEAKSFGAALVYFTGSKQHNIVLRGRAKDRGLKVNEYGAYRDDEFVAGETEEEVYVALDLPWIAPELREARQEIARAEAGELPKLIERDDLRGDLHLHTSESDGAATLEEMVAAAAQRGLSYLAVTDHSQRVAMANGLDADRLRRQWEAIDQFNEQGGDVLVLKGVEVDILENGPLDLADDVLAEADWVVASLHYGQRQPREKITARLVGALENPYVDVIGHPTGRLIGRRPPYEVDLEAVMDAAVRYGKFLELNANPARLDLNDVYCAAAQARGVPIVISSDAHATGGYDVLRFGVLQARRAGLSAGDVVNTRDWKAVDALRRKLRSAN